MSTPRTTERTDRLATVEELRRMLRRHGQGATLVDTTSAPEPPSPPTDAPPATDELEASCHPGTLSLITGPWSSGKTTLALQQVARATGAGQWAAVVDARGWLFPPALVQLEVELSRLLLLQPRATRATWAAEQVLRSGLFALVALLGSRRLGQGELRRLQLAAERGRAAGLLVPRRPAAAGPGIVWQRIQVEPQPIVPDRGSSVAAPPRRCRLELARRGEADDAEPRRADLALG